METKDVKLKKKAISITLSHKSTELLGRLKDYTEAESSSEVIRDSLRLSASIMAAQESGFRVELTNPSDPNARSVILGVGDRFVG